MTTPSEDSQKAFEIIKQASHQTDIDLTGAKVRRTSSRFCLGVEHGDYNGTELFGIGTDRFIWFAYKPSASGRIKLFSGNFPDDGVVDFPLGEVPEPQAPEVADTWARFAYGVEYILRQQGYPLQRGIEGIIYGNIPGGGMSRSASLTLNLILSLFDVNGIEVDDPLKIVDLAQAVENVYIGSPCGQLDQIMILFAREGMGTHYNPKTRSINYVPLGPAAIDFRIVVLDTGTVRPGLEKSTYKIRRAECEEFAALLGQSGYQVSCLADVKDEAVYEKIMGQFGTEKPDHCARLNYIFHAQQRFHQMLEAWKQGDIETVGAIFRADGIGLRDDYKISGAELETMCDIARSVPGVLGERMLGGGDKGASGAIVLAEAEDSLKYAVDSRYGEAQPDYADKYAMHVCTPVAGVTVEENAL